MVTRSSNTRVRKAKTSDAEALCAVFRDAWRLAYTGIIPAPHLEKAIRRRDTQWWRDAIQTERHMLVLEATGRVVGYATCGASRANPRATGEIYELYVAPVYQGIGLGEHLFEGCRATIDRLGLRGLVVWALADNEAASEFYRHRGGRPAHRATERFGGTALQKIAYIW
jgi:GNAT superfamily N-acetyltransferase